MLVDSSQVFLLLVSGARICESWGGEKTSGGFEIALLDLLRNLDLSPPSFFNTVVLLLHHLFSLPPFLITRFASVSSPPPVNQVGAAIVLEGKTFRRLYRAFFWLTIGLFVSTFLTLLGALTFSSKMGEIRTRHYVFLVSFGACLCTFSLLSVEIIRKMSTLKLFYQGGHHTSRRPPLLAPLGGHHIGHFVLLTVFSYHLLFNFLLSRISWLDLWSHSCLH